MFSPETVDIILEYGQLGLALMAFCESVFFPIPPDFVLLPMAMMRPEMSLWYALLTTVASVAGAMVGYGIGRKQAGLLLTGFPQDKISAIEVLFSKYGGRWELRPSRPFLSSCSPDRASSGWVFGRLPLHLWWAGVHGFSLKADWFTSLAKKPPHCWAVTSTWPQLALLQRY